MKKNYVIGLDFGTLSIHALLESTAFALKIIADR